MSTKKFSQAKYGHYTDTENELKREIVESRVNTALPVGIRTTIKLTVYLRLTGEKVPAIYGPSADEGKV